MTKDELTERIAAERDAFIAGPGKNDIEQSDDYNEGFRTGVEAFAVHLMCVFKL
jgi:hypothetical protein